MAELIPAFPPFSTLSSVHSHFLHQLRVQQHEVKLADDSAEEVVKEYARRNVEQLLQKAMDALKATGDDSTAHVRQLSTPEYNMCPREQACISDVQSGVYVIASRGYTPNLARTEKSETRLLYPQSE